MSGKIIVTRPMPEGQAYAQELAAQGFDALCAPMLEIRERDFEVVDLADYQGLVFTSAQAVRSFAERVAGRDCAVFCVGDYTANIAREYGFTRVHSAKGAAEDVLALVEVYASGGLPFLHVRGEFIARDLMDDFAALGHRLCSLVVYGADYVDVIDGQCVDAMRAGAVRAVTFFSRRTASNFMEIAEREGFLENLKGIKALCISRGVVECVRVKLWADVVVARQPDRRGVLALLQDL